jgi:RNA recognition motif-containing protein
VSVCLSLACGLWPAVLHRYPSFQKSRVVKDSKSGKSKGYGFVSFKDPWDMTKALREMQGKYVGNRPIKIRKSTMQERTVTSEHQPLKFEHALSVADKSTKRKLERGGAIRKAPSWKQKPKKGMPW